MDFAMFATLALLLATSDQPTLGISCSSSAKPDNSLHVKCRVTNQRQGAVLFLAGPFDDHGPSSNGSWIPPHGRGGNLLLFARDRGRGLPLGSTINLVPGFRSGDLMSLVRLPAGRRIEIELTLGPAEVARLGLDTGDWVLQVWMSGIELREASATLGVGHGDRCATLVQQLEAVPEARSFKALFRQSAYPPPASERPEGCADTLFDALRYSGGSSNTMTIQRQKPKE